MTDRLGDLVIEANNISKGYGDRLLIDNLSFKIPKGAIVGIIGPNGAGKTTLFRMITGQEKPDAGEIRIGETVDLGYVDQSRDELDPNKNVWEEISDGLDMIQLGKKEMPSRAYVGQFNFKGGDQQKKVGQLSGGERNRVHLATVWQRIFLLMRATVRSCGLKETLRNMKKTRSAASATTLWYRMPLSTGNLPARETLV